MHSYFGSANGYNGFISLFDEKFNSNETDKIFVLKGGPGTGKSTLIKKLIKKIENSASSIETYFCSSDINSLDGAIFEMNDKKVAIIDGTAPHERDAIYVGVVDEIINLGESLNTKSLSFYKNKILHLHEQKSDAYKNAYRYLKLAGKCDEEIYKLLEQNFDKGSAIKYISDLLNSIPKCEDAKHQRAIVSSFSKDGYVTLVPEEFERLKKVNFSGNSRTVEMLIRYINGKIKDKKTCCYLSPLDKEHLEFLKINDEVLFSHNENAADINADHFINSYDMIEEKVKVVKRTHDELLTESIRWFGIASSVHFELEELYKSCMNFERNNYVLEQTYEKILEICS